MEIRDLRYFRTVIDAGGVTRAADVLHMSPGALSKALHRFEEDLGHKLLKRSGRNLVMTEVGERLYRRSTRLLEEHASLLADLDTAVSGPPTNIRIASFEVFTTCFMAHTLQQHLPEAEVEVLEVLVGQIERAVVDRTVDYGLTYVPVPSDQLSFRRIGRLELGVFGLRSAFAGAPFEELPFVVPVNRVQLPSGERMGIDGWPYHRFPRRVKYRVTLMQTAIELACRGMAVLVAPHFVAALHNTTAKRSRQLCRFPNPKGMEKLHQQLHLICRNDDRDEPRTRSLAATLRSSLTEVCSMRVPARQSA